MRYERFNTVEKIGPLTIVGVSHGYKESEELVARAIEDKDPDLMAIEDYLYLPYIQGSSSGIERAKQYSVDSNTPMLLLDQSRQWLWEILGDKTEEVVRCANEEQHRITRLGDIEIEAIIDSRERVRNNFGQEAYNAIFTKREQVICSRLKAAVRETKNKIVAVVGCFHVQSIRDLYSTVEPSEDIHDRIIRPEGAENRWER